MTTVVMVVMMMVSITTATLIFIVIDRPYNGEDRHLLPHGPVDEGLGEGEGGEKEEG